MTYRVTLIAAIVMLVMTGTAVGWHTDGHELLARDAVALLPDEIPAFFRAEVDIIGRLAIEPDVMKLRATTELRAAEEPEHYLDLEDLEGRKLPADRFAFLDLLAELGLEPEEIGLLPFATIEWTQRLMLAFAQHRHDREDRSAQRKALFYAGILSHYATDLVQPLHTTKAGRRTVALVGDSSSRRCVDDPGDGGPARSRRQCTTWLRRLASRSARPARGESRAGRPCLRARA